MTGQFFKRASIYTLGCRLNQAETALLTERLQEAGYTLVPFGEPADLGVLNTCTVTGEADTKSRKSIRGFIRKNPEAVVAVVGCYSQLCAADIARIPGVDVVLGNVHKLDLAALLPQKKRDKPLILCDEPTREDFTIDLCGSGVSTRRANLKIQDGCDCFCTYCVVPFARGLPRSRHMDNLFEEAQRLVERGAKEIVLTGVNVGSYASGGDGLVEVVDRLNAIAGLQRIRISSIELKTIAPALLDRMADAAHALTPFLHVPLQSGSNTVLQRMKRNYTAEEYASFAAQATARVDDLGIGADVLVGMPGETDEEFEETYAFVRDCPLAYLHVFKYSVRPGTIAAKMPGHVDSPTLQRRSEAMRALGNAKRQAFQQARLGAAYDVLFESRQEESWLGYTGNYIRVSVCSKDNLENSIRPVVLDRTEGNIAEGHLDDRS
ncbi:MAG: tRNA (N(6)-L-threonylcarbamoyladenosine(37)-C(2))-methylthiotransferase MtaB [Nitrospiraceae bacterium]|nr:tRNA (N(6)-L-threonylcarbamoyladenosine(37)-C(2))-methylthiotransferase MtaB [Nitrospiraceae bacterium]